VKVHYANFPKCVRHAGKVMPYHLYIASYARMYYYALSINLIAKPNISANYVKTHQNPQDQMFVNICALCNPLHLCYKLCALLLIIFGILYILFKCKQKQLYKTYVHTYYSFSSE
jgi:hypothetical protein